MVGGEYGGVRDGELVGHDYAEAAYGDDPRDGATSGKQAFHPDSSFWVHTGVSCRRSLYHFRVDVWTCEEIRVNCSHSNEVK